MESLRGIVRKMPGGVGTRSILLHQRQERRVEAAGFLDLVCILAKEQDILVDQFTNDFEPEYLSQISTRNELLHSIARFAMHV